MGGVSLQAERSIAIGDWIRIGEVEEMIRETCWHQASIQTRDWGTIVIPNSVLMKSAVTVLGRRAGTLGCASCVRQVVQKRFAMLRIMFLGSAEVDRFFVPA